MGVVHLTIGSSGLDGWPLAPRRDLREQGTVMRLQQDIESPYFRLFLDEDFLLFSYERGSLFALLDDILEFLTPILEKLHVIHRTLCIHIRHPRAVGVLIDLAVINRQIVDRFLSEVWGVVHIL